MSLRRQLAATLTALVLLAGCGSSTSEDAAKGATTTTTSATDGSETTAPDDTTPQPTSTVSNEDFVAAIAPLKEQLASGADLCTFFGTFANGLPDPSGPDQIREAVDVITGVFSAIGKNISAEDPVAGNALIDAAAALKVEAETAGYPDSILNDNQAFNTEEFRLASESLSTIAAKQCENLTQAPGATGE